MGTVIRHSFVDTNGIRMHVTDAGVGYPLVLLHGFPELWYAWRKQIYALADAGFRVIAPDLRGYGGTDAPEEASAYALSELVEDLQGLFDALGFDTAGVVGHDWGGALAWEFALRHPERTARVASLCTPLVLPGPLPMTAMLRDYFGLTDATFYMRRFLDPGVAEAELEADVRTTFQKMLRPARYASDLWTFATVGGDGSSLLGKIGPGDCLLSKVDLETYVRIYKRTGFRGGLNWYRAADGSWERERELPMPKLERPAMLILAEKDPILRPEFGTSMKALVPDLRVEMLADCAHWVQQERPAEVNALLIDFFGDLRDPDLE
jgi:pimeloyl-ACP methyl ester carboxylesterase